MPQGKVDMEISPFEFLSPEQRVLFKSFKFCLFVTVKLVILSQDAIFINFCLVQFLKVTLRWIKELY